MAHVKFKNGCCYIEEEKLTPNETKLLFGFMFNRFLTKEKIIEILWPDVEDQPDWYTESLRVIIFRLRRKLKGSGWTLKANHTRHFWEMIHDRE